MGSVMKRKNGRTVIQWIDGSGRQRQETLPRNGKDGKPLTEKGAERKGRNRLVDYEGKARRPRQGLEPLPTASLDMLFDQLVDWWWESHGQALKSPAIRGFLKKHLSPKLGRLPLREVTTVKIEGVLTEKEAKGELSGRSLNHLRGFMHNIYEFARKDGGPWAGRANPVADVSRRKQEEPARNILTVPEFEPVLDKTPSNWRGPVATAVYGGLREGEIFGLLKADLDFDALELRVHRSWDAERTKDNKVARIPIVPQLVPFLREAMKSPGVFVFPKADGSMQPRKLRLGKILRRAIAAAGLLEGYEHRCRAWRCGWREQRQDLTAPATCPRCGKPTAWSRPIPRHVRFHDTRHSFGTAVVRAAGTAVAQKALRHSDVRLTIHTYGHLDTKDVRAGLTGAFGTPSGTTSAGGADCTELQSTEKSPGDATRTAPGTAGNQRKSPATPRESRGQVMVGETGFEPATPWSRRAEGRSVQRGTGSPGVVSLRQHWGRRWRGITYGGTASTGCDAVWCISAAGRARCVADGS